MWGNSLYKMECMFILCETIQILYINRIKFIIPYIALKVISNKFSFEKIIEKFLIYFKRATN